VTLRIDHFRLGIDCDSASYSARFLALAKPSVIARSNQPIEAGCS
jgi:hypothetical protein